jgi:hypothetical protein
VRKVRRRRKGEKKRERRESEMKKNRERKEKKMREKAIYKGKGFRKFWRWPKICFSAKIFR